MMSFSFPNNTGKKHGSKGFIMPCNGLCFNVEVQGNLIVFSKQNIVNSYSEMELKQYRQLCMDSSIQWV